MLRKYIKNIIKYKMINKNNLFYNKIYYFYNNLIIISRCDYLVTFVFFVIQVNNKYY